MENEGEPDAGSAEQDVKHAEQEATRAENEDDAALVLVALQSFFSAQGDVDPLNVNDEAGPALLSATDAAADAEEFDITRDYLAEADSDEQGNRNLPRHSTSTAPSSSPRAAARPRRKRARESVAQTKAAHHAWWIVDELRVKLHLKRTTAAVTAARKSFLDALAQDELGLGDAAVQRIKSRVQEGEMAEAIVAEICGAVYLAKKHMLRRAMEDGVTGVALERLIRGWPISSTPRASLRACLARLVYLRTWQQAEQLLRERPDLDARRCNTSGTYVIIVVYKDAKGKKRSALYVGCAYDQRTAEHDALSRSCVVRRKRRISTRLTGGRMGSGA